MLRIVFLTFCLALGATAATANFEGIWKGQFQSKPLVVTILSDHPPRGTMSRGEGGADLFLQDIRIVKGVLRFKIIDPSDGVIQYEMKVVSREEGALTVAGHETVTLRRK